MCDQQSLRSACACAQSYQSLCLSLEYSMSVKLLAEHHFEFLRLKGGCTGSSESMLVKIPHCWKSHVTAHIRFIGPRREKTCLRSFVNNKGADQPAHPRSLISAFIIHFLEASYLSLIQAKFNFLANFCS